VQYGLWFSESFVDAPDRDRQRHNGIRDVRALMNLHNNEVGRKVRVNNSSLFIYLSIYFFGGLCLLIRPPGSDSCSHCQFFCRNFTRIYIKI